MKKAIAAKRKRTQEQHKFVNQDYPKKVESVKRLDNKITGLERANGCTPNSASSTTQLKYVHEDMQHFKAHNNQLKAEKEEENRKK